MKKRYGIPLMILGVLVFLAIGFPGFGQEGWLSIRRNLAERHLRNHAEQMKQVAQTVAATGETNTYRGWDVIWLDEDQLVIFRVDYFGFGQETTERGMIWTQTLPNHLMGLDYECPATWHAASIYSGGGNSMMIWQIMPEWYWYEFHW